MTFNLLISCDPSNEAIAGKGFCLCKLKHYKEAAVCYQEAIKKGFKTAINLNNLGYCYYRAGQHNEAIETLEEACAMDDALQSAHLLLVICYANKGLNGLPFSDSAPEHARKALIKGPPSKELYYFVALFEAVCAKNDQSFMASSMDHMEKAIDGGMTFTTILHLPVFDIFRKDQRFQKLSSRRMNTASYPPVTFLLDPFITR